METSNRVALSLVVVAAGFASCFLAVVELERRGYDLNVWWYSIPFVIAAAWGIAGRFVRELPVIAALCIAAAYGSWVLRWWLWARSCPDCSVGDWPRSVAWGLMSEFGAFVAGIALAGLAAGVVGSWLVGLVSHTSSSRQAKA
jgi:hypothetical protein